MCDIWKTICTSSIEVEENEFWTAGRVWVERPHIINRRLMGIDVSNNLMLDFNENKELTCSSISVLLKDCIIKGLDAKTVLQNHFQVTESNELDMWEENGNNTGIFVQIRRLLPKQPDKFGIQNETVILDKEKRTIVFLSPFYNGSSYRLTPDFDYRLVLMDCKRIKIEISNYDKEKLSDNQSIQWLESHVLRKISSWAKQCNKFKPIPSLSIVPISNYYSIYQRLKKTYWQKLMKMWPEGTDPVKYIYEDIAIAAYLITIFELEKETRFIDHKQTFVDLGCGNGLLVYLLTSEGYSGIGIDVRKRVIWDVYEPKVQLLEMTVTPSDKMLFPEYDWLIGNHSDELTPWIPVIAARSSYNMRLFLLPCCPFSFEGKYQRLHSNCSQYQSYLYFIKEVCQKMGFEVQEDKLRIPSTKRFCFVCLSRNYSLSKEAEMDLQRTVYINKFLKLTINNNVENYDSIHKSEGLFNLYQNSSVNEKLQLQWICQFQPRNKIQEVCNCSNLDHNYLEEVVNHLASVLLRLEDNYISVSNTDQDFLWNKGGELPIGTLASQLNSEKLQQLKHQCGGIQTLLRNHRHIFTVKNAKVSITVPTKETSAKQTTTSRRGRRKELKFKTKSCWFYINHPQGCPLPKEDCSYIHGDEKNSN